MRYAKLNRRLFIITLLLTLPGFRDIVEDHQLDAQSTASYGTTVTSLNSSSTGAVTGISFAVPSSYAAIITWQVVADGSALNVNLEGSNDNVTYSTVDSQTIALGGIKNFGFTSVKFIRCSQVSRTGGTNTSCTLVINRGFINGGNFSLNRVLTGDGTTTAPAYSFLSEPTTGFSRSASGKIIFSGTMFQFGGTTSSFPAFKQSGTTIQTRLADDSGDATFSASRLFFASSINATNVLIGAAAPTISSGFGSAATIPFNNGTASFVVNVGTGGAATSGVIGLAPTAANGWNCHSTDITATSTHTALETMQTASTTTTATIESQSRSTGAATAWATGSLVRMSCFAY